MSLNIPFEPLSTSMPNTCDTYNVSRFKPPPKPRAQIPNVIAQLMMPYHADLLTRLVNESIADIARVFYDNKMPTELTLLQTTMSKASHNTRLAVFFLLLNVNQHLKSRIQQLEIEKNQRKLERFLIDLKRVLVVQFFVNEGVNVQAFVRQCEENWVLA